MSTGGTKEGLTKRDIPSGAMTPMRARASPAAPRRLVVSLDLDAEDVPCVNYKKLLKEQGGAGASSRPSAEKGSSEKLAREAAAERMKDGHSSLLEAPTGGGGHMAAVIRRIEALYQGGRGNASSDEEEDEEEDSDEEEDEDGEEGEDGEEDEEEDGEEDDEDDDSGSEMEDPDDKPTMTPNGSRVVAPAPKEKSSEEKKQKPAKKKKKAKRKGDIDWYDVDDDFIDDDELDEYFEDDGLKTKHSGFFINKGELQKVDEEGRTPVKRSIEDEEPKKAVEKAAKKPKVTEWSEETKKLLRLAVSKYGLQWKMIHDSGEFDDLRSFSTSRMRAMWKVIQEELKERGIDVIVPSNPPKPPNLASAAARKEANDDDDDDPDAGLSTPNRPTKNDPTPHSSKKKKAKGDEYEVGDPRHPDAKQQVRDGKDAEFKKLKSKITEECNKIRANGKTAEDPKKPGTFIFEWSNELAEEQFCVLARLFFASSKADAQKIWDDLVALWPKDFPMTEIMLRRVHKRMQIKKSATEKAAILGLPEGASV